MQAHSIRPVLVQKVDLNVVALASLEKIMRQVYQMVDVDTLIVLDEVVINRQAVNFEPEKVKAKRSLNSAFTFISQVKFYYGAARVVLASG